VNWQDWVFFVGGLFVLVSLIPTISGNEKPALATSVTTCVLVAVFTITMASLGLWLSALTNALISLAWGALAVQRWHRGSPATTPRAELEPLGGSEGS
jgi:hypothetical protein